VHVIDAKKIMNKDNKWGDLNKWDDNLTWYDYITGNITIPTWLWLLVSCTVVGLILYLILK
jgi:hypothetical protein